MREIKFRCWLTDEKRMISWDEMCDTNAEDYEDLKNYFVFDGDAPFSNCTAPMQYTGQKDKNGKEIYEGDIVRNNWVRIDGKFIGKNWIVKFGEYDNSDIEYGSPAIGFYCESDGEEEGLNNLPTNTNSHDIEVVGNIHENPELLHHT